MRRCNHYFRCYLSPYTASSDNQQQSVWDDREFVIAIGVAGVALILLVLLLITTCMLIHYYRKLDQVNKYSLGEWTIAGIYNITIVIIIVVVRDCTKKLENKLFYLLK